jgi:1,4-dihydroxy-2-naphthoate polyprenyltransferase
MKKLWVWLRLIRINYLVLAFLLVGIGTSLAFSFKPDGYVISVLDIILVFLGVVFAHASVNLLNEYSDYESGIEQMHIRSPFTGGRNLLVEGTVKPFSVLLMAITFLIVALVIGIYFTITSHMGILIFMLIGGISILGYIDYLTRFLANELISGFVLGTVVILGTYLALIHVPYVPLLAAIPVGVWLISLIPGLLTALLLILVKFPNAEKESKSGRKPLAAALGRKKAATLYSVGATITFLLIVLLPIIGVSSYWIYLALLPIPYILTNIYLRLKTIHDAEELIGALRNNVVVIILTDMFIFLAVILQVVIQKG